MKKKRVVVGHGEGTTSKKSIDMALKGRHRNVSFVSTEILESKYREYLKRIKQTEKPKNLVVKSRTCSIDYLRRQASNSIDHQYAHFSASSIKHDERKQLFKQIFRTLVPGGRFIVVEPAFTENEFKMQLAHHGFKVSSKRVSPEEIAKLGTEQSRDFSRDKDQMLMQMGGMPPQQYIKELQQKWFLVRLQQEGPNASKGTRKSLERMVKELGKSFSQKPFVVITARKPRR